MTKRFGGLVALQDVSLDVSPGEVHAVVGENGAGKSTLMGVLAGFIVPEEGMAVSGASQIRFGEPLTMRKLGLSMVHQHFTLVPRFTVAENFALSSGAPVISRHMAHEVAKEAKAMAGDLGWSLDTDETVGSLSVGRRQRVEILKALLGGRTVLVLDEPTAVLSPNEVEDLFDVLRRLKEQGTAVVLIAHKLREVFSIADRVTVLRSGRAVGSCLVEDTSSTIVAEQMVGPRSSEPGPRASLESGEICLNVESIVVLGDQGNVAIDGVTLTVREGEIVGIGGVDGNGQVELAEALSGIRPIQSGKVTCASSVGYIPQDRRHDALALNLSVRDNLSVGMLRGPRANRGPFLNSALLGSLAQELIRTHQIKVVRDSLPVSSLSGGNQQKVVVARVLSQNPKLLVAVNPTRGLDFSATESVHEKIRVAAAGGAGVVLISTDTDELDALATQTRFLSRGRLTGSLLGDS